MTIDNDYLLKKNTILIRALIISGVINIVVLSFLSYWIIRERPPSPYCELKPQKKEYLLPIIDSNVWADRLSQLSSSSYKQLIHYLGSSQMIGNYREKDIALACLNRFYHFDLQRAMMPQNLPEEKHVLKWHNHSNELIALTLYPHLKETDFQTIIQFAKTESWPLTTQGLFLKLQSQFKWATIDPKLIETLAMTSEFWSMELLLNRGEGPTLTKMEIAKLITEGNWEILTQFVEQQRQNHDLSEERRRQVLLEYIKLNSDSAAEFIIRLDKDYVLKKMDDAQILTILHLLTAKTKENEDFVKTLLVGPHSEQVWQNAASLLYRYADEKKPEVWNYEQIVTRFTTPSTKKMFQPFSHVNLPAQPTPVKNKPLITEKKTVSKNPLNKNKIISYKVQKGDTLWKISQKFKVKIEKIREMNHLNSDSIKQGTLLKIPG